MISQHVVIVDHIMVKSHKVKVMTDTGSTTCVVKRFLVEAEQMTGNHELCMLIDGVVKRFPTAIVTRAQQ